LTGDPPAVAIALLAAGGSRRLGRPKQLIAVDGQPLVRRMVTEACASAAARVAVVVGAHAEEVDAALAELPCARLHNPDWSRGLSSSVGRAARWAAQTASAALILCVVDQPALERDHLDRLIAAYRAGARRVASGYAGVRGVPALFDARDFPALQSLAGDRGAAAMLTPGTLTISWPPGAVDLDTDEDLRRWADPEGGGDAPGDG
jgi:xanthine dehydrogenase accessory factor